MHTPSLVFRVRVVPKKTTDVPMMTTRFTYHSRHTIFPVPIRYGSL